MNQLNNMRILLLGGSGKLGKAIKNNSDFDYISMPTSIECNLLEVKSIINTIKKNSPTHIINCAAEARRKVCQNDPIKAISVNTIGTANLVQSIISLNSANKRVPRLIHISTDAVYKDKPGLNKESDPTIPLCSYGWTKLAAECSVRLLQDYLIIRTRFYSPEDIPFEDAAVDIKTSSMPIEKLSLLITKLTKINYNGVINIGSESMSDFQRYRLCKPSIRPASRLEIENHSGLPFSSDYSMSLSLMHKILHT